MLQLITTADGSKTIFNPEVGENYHSKHGALQESRHVFLQSGLVYFLDHHPAREVSILEVGLGTGLNFLLTADYCRQNGIRLDYTGIEAYPLTEDLIASTGYDAYVSPDTWGKFLSAYSQSYNQRAMLNAELALTTAVCKLAEFHSTSKYDVLYFDAFAAVHQPEMWETKAIQQVCQYLKPGGVFVTYAITGNLKRTMKSLGFDIEKAKGAPGKREMLRAVKAL